MKKLIITLYFATLSLVVEASTLSCVGSVDAVNVNSDGGVAIISNDMFGDLNGRTICSLKDTDIGVPIDVCKSWVSQGLASYASGTKIRIAYLNSSHSTCSDIPAWSSAELPRSFSNWY